MDSSRQWKKHYIALIPCYGILYCDIDIIKVVYRNFLSEHDKSRRGDEGMAGRITYGRCMSLCLILLWTLAGCVGGGERKTGMDHLKRAQVRSEDDRIVLENSKMAIAFSKKNGSIAQIRDVVRGLDFLASPGETPFRIQIGNDIVTSFRTFSYLHNAEQTDGQSYTLTWELRDGVTLSGCLFLPDDGDQVRFTSHVKNVGDKSVLYVEYPVIGGIASLGKTSALAHSYATGLLIHDPDRQFINDGDGLRFTPYPESFSGASMQWFTYYCKDKGGLYVAALDGESHQKWLNFYRMNHSLEISHMYGYEEVKAGNSLKADYPFILQLVSGQHEWYEAADRYKQWATQQYWCKRGPAQQRRNNQKATWLLEDMGLSTFGISACHDRSDWIHMYHKAADTKIFHVLGPDWPRTDQNYYNGVPGGMGDWFPTRFDPTTLKTIRELGDRFAPFEFDFLVDPNKNDGNNLKANLQSFPDPTFSQDEYNFNMLCPATAYTQNFHTQRDLKVYQEVKADSMYYDISANNLIKICMNPSHGHPVGGSTAITNGYQKTYEKTRQAMSREAGAYIPLGTEMMNEVFLRELDYYQARAWAQPCSALETWPFHSLIKSGAAEIIPMFTYVYNEYGIVRLDGWGKLVDEIGDLYYQTVARTYAWGGLYELNYEYSPMETINGVEPAPEEHYYQFKPRGYPYSSEKGEYLRQFAALRTGVGNRYLAYGTMQHPLPLNSPMVRMKWFMFNHDTDERGVYEAPALVQGAWKSTKDNKTSLGFVIANTSDQPVDIDVSIDPSEYGLKGRTAARLLTGFTNDGFEQISLDSREAQIALNETLNARTVYLIEINQK